MSEKATETDYFEIFSTSAVCLIACLTSIWPNPFLTVTLGLILISMILFKGSFAGIRYSVVMWGAILLVTAAIGTWGAYQSSNAYPKLFNIILALLVALYFNRVAGQNNWALWGLGAGSLFFAFVFGFTKLGLLDPGVLMTPNRLAGLSAILVPFLILAFIKSSNLLFKICIGFSGLVVAVSLLLSGSRGAIGAIILSLIIWYLVTQREGSNRQLFFVGGQALFYITLAIGGVGIYLAGGLQNSPLAQIPGADTRIELYANSLHLIRDFWVVGGGLNSFGGLYSQYIVSVPFLLFTYGHNLYLDLLLELGILGLLSVLAILIGSILVGFKYLKANVENRHFIGAAIASVTILLFHGFIDDAVFGDSGSPLLFISAGILFKLCQPKRAGELLPIHALTSFALVVSIVLFNPVDSAQSNLISIDMAKIQLESWPTNEWSKGEHAAGLNQLRPSYQQILSNQPDHSPTSYHVGLIEMESREFEQAVQSLTAAYTQNPDHPGIQKNLGMATLWTGDIEGAIDLLKDIPGINGEIDAYIWWWAEQGEQELSNRASDLKNNPGWGN